MMLDFPQFESVVQRNCDISDARLKRENIRRIPAKGETESLGSSVHLWKIGTENDLGTVMDRS